MLLWNEVWYFFNLQINEALGNENTSYRRHQSSGEELPTRLYRVKKGTFNKLGDYLIEANPSTSPIQFETPRFITKKEAGDLLLANLHPQHVPSTWPPGTLNGLPSSDVFLTFIIETLKQQQLLHAMIVAHDTELQTIAKYWQKTCSDALSYTSSCLVWNLCYFFWNKNPDNWMVHL